MVLISAPVSFCVQVCIVLQFMKPTFGDFSSVWTAAESDKLWLYSLMPVGVCMLRVDCIFSTKLSWNVLNAAVLFPAKSISTLSIQSCAKPYTSAETLTTGWQWTNSSVMIWNKKTVILFEIYFEHYYEYFILYML